MTARAPFFRMAGMAHRLRDDLAYAICGTKVIFLDLLSERYFGIEGEEAAALREFAHGNPIEKAKSEIRRRLMSLGVLVPSVSDVFPTAPDVPQPIESALEDGSGRTRLHLMPGVIFNRSRTARRLRALPLRVRIEQLKQRKTRSRAVPGSDALDDVVRSANAARYLFNIHDQCLVTSLALLDYLSTHGFHADLVLGVRATPFSAHAWVQAGGRILNDRIDTVRLYRPILVA